MTRSSYRGRHSWWMGGGWIGSDYETTTPVASSEYLVAGIALDSPEVALEIATADGTAVLGAKYSVPGTAGSISGERPLPGLLVAGMPLPLPGTRYPLLVVVVGPNPISSRNLWPPIPSPFLSAAYVSTSRSFARVIPTY